MRVLLRAALLAGIVTNTSGCKEEATSDGLSASSDGLVVVAAATPDVHPAVASEADPAVAGLADAVLAPATDVENQKNSDSAKVAISNKNSYPDQATVSIRPASFSQNAKEVYVQVALDHATPNTIVMHVTATNGTLNSTYFTPVDQVVYFYPDDVLVKTVRVPILKYKAGGTFKANISYAGGVKATGLSSVNVTAVDNAPATVPAPAGRAPIVYSPIGTLQYKMDTSNLKWSAAGGAGVWRSTFTHGRGLNPGLETGLYMDETAYPSAEKAIQVKDGALVLHTQKLASPVNYAGGNGGYAAGTYSYGAAVLNGLRMPETQITRGTYEWSAKMPDRAGTWPCLWLGGVIGWPPEIDVFEGMSYVSGWNTSTTIWSSIHGGPVGKQTFAPGQKQTSALYGVQSTTSTFNTYAVTLQKRYITFFVNGKETWQVVNMFDGLGAFYPLMSVGVTANNSNAYNTGSGDMAIRAFKVYAKSGDD